MSCIRKREWRRLGKRARRPYEKQDWKRMVRIRSISCSGFRSFWAVFRRKLREGLSGERGEVNMVAIVLILLVVLALAAIFRESLTALLSELLDKIKQEALRI